MVSGEATEPCGTLHLRPENTVVLGGHVDALIDRRSLGRCPALARYLGALDQ